MKNFLFFGTIVVLNRLGHYRNYLFNVRMHQCGLKCRVIICSGIIVVFFGKAVITVNGCKDVVSSPIYRADRPAWKQVKLFELLASLQPLNNIFGDRTKMQTILVIQYVFLWYLNWG